MGVFRRKCGGGGGGGSPFGRCHLRRSEKKTKKKVDAVGGGGGGGQNGEDDAEAEAGDSSLSVERHRGPQDAERAAADKGADGKDENRAGTRKGSIVGRGGRRRSRDEHDHLAADEKDGKSDNSGSGSSAFSHLPPLPGRGDPPSRASSFQQNLIFHNSSHTSVLSKYEILELIGEGSISSISKVRKLNVGGSARLSHEERRRRRRRSEVRWVIPWAIGGRGAMDGLLGGGGLFGRCTKDGKGRKGPRKGGGWRKESSSSSSFLSISGKGGMKGLAPPPLSAPSAAPSTPSTALVTSDRSSTRDRNLYALKTIHLRLVKDEYLQELRNEIEIFRQLDHPNIAKAYETFSRKNHLCVVMELCTGGDLHSRAPYTEKEACTIIGKLLSAVAYLHKNGVVHRDLKYENVLFESSSPDAEIKLIDFGLARKYLSPDHVMTERVGTVYTMAPEVIRGEYTFKADLWSIGVIAYMLLSNTKPFWGKKKKRIVEKVMRGRYNFLGPGWSHVSREARHFVRSLLLVDPSLRLTAQQAQQHPWLDHSYPLSARRPPQRIMDEVNANIVRYADGGEFKRVVLNVVAHKSTAEEIFELRKAFDQYDRNNDGAISYEGFRTALSERLEYTDEETEKMFRCLDFNENGVIFYTEFLAAALEAQGRIEEERLAEAFDRIDSDDTGYISKENLRQILGTKCTDEYAARLLSEADVLDNDGQVSYEEFLSLFLGRKNREIRDMYDADPAGARRSSSSSSEEEGDDKEEPSEEEEPSLSASSGSSSSSSSPSNAAAARGRE